MKDIESQSGGAKVRSVLVVDPDPMWGPAAARVLQTQGWSCFLERKPRDATYRLHRRSYDAFVISAKIGNSVVDSLIRDIRTRYFRTRVVLILPDIKATLSETWRFFRGLVVLQRPCSLEKIFNAVNGTTAPGLRGA